jgi:hypothetical protein
MLVPVLGEYRTYDFGSLIATGTQERRVGDYISCSGVKSGALVIRFTNVNINALSGAKIEVFVRAAWQDSVGELAIDASTAGRVALITFDNSYNSLASPALVRVNFSGSLPTPGLVVTVVGTMGSGIAALTADLGIALELLPT